jgi:hypothetical protein
VYRETPAPDHLTHKRKKLLGFPAFSWNLRYLVTPLPKGYDLMHEQALTFRIRPLNEDLSCRVDLCDNKLGSSADDAAILLLLLSSP